MNANEFPTLGQAVAAMCMDNGIRFTVESVDSSISVICYLFLPDEITRAEAELKTLSLESLETLCCGCEDDWPPVHDNTLKVVNALFNTI